MPEQTREQHQLLSGTALNPQTYFGGFITALGGIYQPAMWEMVNGNHFMSLVNLYDSLYRRFGSAFYGYIYKNTTDANNRFSVKAFTLVHRGLNYTYAGGSAIGPLTTGVNYVWANLPNSSGTISIGFGAAWPTTPHLRLGVIDMPASGHWLPDNTFSSVADHTCPSGTTKFKKKLIHTDTGVKDVERVPAGAVIAKMMVFVKTAFNGTTPTLKLGDLADDDRLGVTGDFTLTATGLYTASRPFEFSAETLLKSTLTIGGSPSAGELWILGEYF